MIHTVECTTAKVADITMMEACLHGEEEIALGDRGYHKTNRTIEHFAKEGDLCVLTPTKKPAGGELTEEQKAFLEQQKEFDAKPDQRPGVPPVLGERRNPADYRDPIKAVSP